MKATILLISLAVLAFKNSFYSDDETLKNTKETAAYIQKISAHEEVVAEDTTEDTSFISKAIQANQHEIMMAQLATQKSSSAEVKELAQRLITDHTQLLQQLQNLRGSNTSNNSSTMNSIADSTGINASYNNISGITFDRQWVSDMIAGHQKTLSDFKTELTVTNDTSLKALINTALPTIQEHLRLLQVLRGKMM